MENLLLILICFLAILFIWAIWARQRLTHHLRSFERHESLLRRDLRKRRDMVPYLLESFRSNNEITPQWIDLLEKRKAFQQNGEASLKQEMEFETALLNFVKAYDIADVNYLEAEKDITEISAIIERSKQGWSNEHDTFIEMKKRFPYSVASAMFGIRL